MFIAARYRLGQLSRALGASLSAEDLALVRVHLTEPQQRLFFQASPALQKHQVRVCRILVEQGETDRDLLVAALLHDVGKGEIALLERGLFVLLAALLPPLLERLSAPRRWAWQQRLSDFLNHAALGARLALDAGVTARAADLIARHHEAAGSNSLQARLRAADDAD